MRLSHSAINKYLDCPKLYEYHYILNYRTTYISSPLTFGSAIDKAIEYLLNNRTKLQNALNIFITEWRKVENDANIQYSKSDIDYDLLSEVTLFCGSFDIIKTLVKKREQNGYASLSKEKNDNFQLKNMSELDLYNLASWSSLTIKADLMIKAFYYKILPKIKKLISTQKEIKLVGGENIIVGFIDMIVEWEDGKTYIMDLKTSGSKYSEYKEDSVRSSQQLGIYSEAEGIRDCGYLVLRKTPIKIRKKTCKVCGYKPKNGNRAKTCDNTIENKRCRGIWHEEITFIGDTRVVLDVITEEHLEALFAKIDQVVKDIQNGVFHKNAKNCEKYGGCPMYNLCRNNIDDGSLYILTKEENLDKI